MPLNFGSSFQDDVLNEGLLTALNVCNGGAASIMKAEWLQEAGEPLETALRMWTTALASPAWDQFDIHTYIVNGLPAIATCTSAGTLGWMVFTDSSGVIRMFWPISPAVGDVNSSHDSAEVGDSIQFGSLAIESFASVVG